MGETSIDKATERLWEQLLDFIDDGRVIPVIGPELLTFRSVGESQLLYSTLATQLAKRLQVEFEATDSLNTVACRYLSEGGQREDIYPELKRVMTTFPNADMPSALVKLAEIKPLKLFVTTCFDSLLVNALDQVRYSGQAKTQVLAFSPGSNNDLPEPVEQLDRTTVFHLFGKLSAVPEYAVTDEDVLEFMHALQAKTARPERLFDGLIKQNLLFIGCPLSDWLGRFFVRIGKKERLIVSSGKTDFLVGDHLSSDENLAEFLRNFSSRTKVFPLASLAFVNELHQRWTDMHPQVSADNITVATTDLEGDKMSIGAVFLSYASEDRPIVMLLRDALEQAGIDVWFDRNPDALRPGDDFAAVIKANMDKASLFVPIISRNTTTPKPRFFRVEWNYAQDLAARYPDNWRFIMPFAIDDTPPDSIAIPEKFRKLHWERLANGQVSHGFVSEIKKAYRDYQRNLMQTA
jgi:TIR domain/SIR2-like domain